MKNELGFEYQSEFVRRYVAKMEERFVEGRIDGHAEGRTEARLDLVLKLLAVRFGALPEGIQTRVRGAQDAELDTLAERLLTAPTLEQALGSL